MSENPINQDHMETELKPRDEVKNPFAVVVALSLLFGMLGGSLSTYYFMRSPSGQAGAQINQKISLTEESAIVDVVKKASPAVVSIVISKDLSKIPGFGLDPDQFDPFYFFFGGRQPQSTPTEPDIRQVGAGSGFFVSGDGLVLTNKHVVQDSSASYTIITSDGKSYDAKVVAQDPVNDLAIMKVDIKDAPFLALADSAQIQIGQRVVAIGNSLGQYQNTVTSGIISGIGRSIVAGGTLSGTEQLSGVIQTDAAINPGNSGGPLLNTAAQVVGINTAIDQQGQLVGFAIPSNDAKKAMESYQKNGRITRPFLGVRYVIVNRAIAGEQKLDRDYGALILRGQGRADYAVIPGSPADRGGLKEGDIILEIDGQRIDEQHPLTVLLRNHNVGDKVTLKVYSNGGEKNVQVTLDEAK